jgi:hypothetical protein
MGASALGLLRRHILSNSVGPIVIELSLDHLPVCGAL